MRILFLIPYPLNHAPSQRFRFEQYLKILEEREHKLKVRSFLSSDNWRILYKGRPSSRFLTLLAGSIRRWRILFEVRSYDVVFIHRETSLMGPPLLTWIIARLFRKRIIYDFDDAIWLTDNVNESFFAQWLRWRRKTRAICRLSHRISVGNSYLAGYARQFNTAVVINPSTIDTEHLHDPRRYHVKKDNSKVVIGWTGSATTIKYLSTIEPVLKTLEARFRNLLFLFIADENPQLSLKSVIFKPWTQENEIRDLLMADIGIMPMPEDAWTKGKCGFKGLQYMALGIPAVVSPVGANKQIVRHAVDGYWCETPEDWIRNLEHLILHEPTRIEMGRQGRQRVIENYSVISNTANFLSLFAL